MYIIRESVVFIIPRKNTRLDYIISVPLKSVFCPKQISSFYNSTVIVITISFRMPYYTIVITTYTVNLSLL